MIVIVFQARLEQKQRDEEDKLYRKFLERRREEEDNVARMGEEEREVRKRKIKN
jgi:hypothetical protein